MTERMTPSQARAFVKQKAEEERARKKAGLLFWRPPTRKEIQKRLRDT